MYQNNQIFILGSGSNILLTKNFDGLVIHVNTKGISVVNDSGKSVTIDVAAGESWHELVMKTTDNQWWGIENLTLIPGTVGAAPVQNIGAYGVEVKDTIVHVEAFDIELKKNVVLNNAECEFEYRSSIFKKNPGKYIVTNVRFTLSKIPKPIIHYGKIQELLSTENQEKLTPKHIAQTVISIRQSKLPAVGEIGMAGSFFKNPVIDSSQGKRLQKQFPDMPQFVINSKTIKIPAAWLIESLGYKGIKQGKVGTYHNHALVVVNYGGATGGEVWNFAQKIIADVHQKYDIELEPEVQIIPNYYD